MPATLAPIPASTALVSAPYSRDQIELIKRTVAIDTTDDELRLFLYQCQKTGLDALTRQIYAIKRKGRLTIQTAIDGFRLIAQRSGEYRGQVGPFWCGPDGRWVDVWVDAQAPPVAARVGVWRANFAEPVWGVARTDAYAARDERGHYAALWRTMPDTMGAKCAEALALRKAFPLELSGLYTSDELDQSPLGAEPAQVERLEAPDMRPAELPEPAPLPARTVVKIKSIVKRPIKGGHKYVITADDVDEYRTEQYHTFSLTTATAAKTAQEAGIAVEILYLPSKYGRMIQSLHEPESGPEPPL